MNCVVKPGKPTKRYAIVHLGGSMAARPTSHKDGTMGTCTQNLERRRARRLGVTRCQRGSARTVTYCCCGFGGMSAARTTEMTSDRYSEITASPASPPT